MPVSTDYARRDPQLKARDHNHVRRRIHAAEALVKKQLCVGPQPPVPERPGR